MLLWGLLQNLEATLEVLITSNSQLFAEDSISQEIISTLKNKEKDLGLTKSVIYYAFPVFTDLEGVIRYPEITLVHDTLGVLLIHVARQSYRTGSSEEILMHADQVNNYLFSRLLRIPSFRVKGKRNELSFQLNSVVVGDIATSADFDYIEVLRTTNELTRKIEDLLKTGSSIQGQVFSELISVIDGSRAILKVNKRNVSSEDMASKGAIMDRLENEIKQFDNQQKLAALSQIDGPQRIRGLAGSGKTVVLAMKAALIHLRQPEARILYTFYTKSLYDHVQTLISRFYRLHKDESPNFEDKIHVRHAWGSESIPGVYYDTCTLVNKVPVTFRAASLELKNIEMFPNEYKEPILKNAKSAFDLVCLDLLATHHKQLQKVYDYVLIDEGQDFNPSFYWLCRRLARKDSIAWAYDELQDIQDVKIQDTKTWFRSPFKDEGIDLERLQKENPYQNNDIVLKKCYRTPREVLVISHAIGFGIYSDRIVQRLENREHWEDLGYLVVSGNCLAGQYTVIERPEENSPSLISREQAIDDMIEAYRAKDFDDEINWVCESIEKQIADKLLPEDIMVVSFDDRNARVYFRKIGEQLLSHEIFSNNVLESYRGDEFSKDNCITFTTVYRAKGNQAAVVYVVGADAFSEHDKNNILQRNKVFTAFTRTLGWLKVSGIGSWTLSEEINKAKSNFPYLKFVYPGEEDIRTLRREWSNSNKRRVLAMEELEILIRKHNLSHEDAMKMLEGISRKSEPGSEN